MIKDPKLIYRQLILNLYDTTHISDVSFETESDHMSMTVKYNFTMGDEEFDMKLKKCNDLFKDTRKTLNDPKLRVSSPITFIKNPISDRYIKLEPSLVHTAKEEDAKFMQLFKIRYD